VLKFDVRNFTDERREALAWKAHEFSKFKLPQLTYWNYDLCRKHRNGWVETYLDEATDNPEAKRTVYDRPMPGCRKCGIHFREHQHISIMWMYLKKSGLLADTMGSGKTTSAGGLIALLLETGEISLRRERGGNGGMGRVIIVPRSPALYQWRDELLRMIPKLNIIVSEGTKAQRKELYLQPWQVLLIGPEMLQGDQEFLYNRFDLSLFLTDDIDSLRNPETATSYACDRMGRKADRYFIMTGTPLQKRLPEIHAVLDAVGGDKVFGSRDTFEKNHVMRQTITKYDERTGLEVGKELVLGYKNTRVLKQQMAPMVLRRTAADLTDVSLPTIIPDDVFLDLYPSQRAKYDELKQGVIRILKEEGELVKHTTALSKLHYGSAICGGLATLGEPDGPKTSMKMDWIMDKVSSGGDLGGEKVVIFAQLKNSVRALQHRFREAGIGFETVWGEEPDKTARRNSQERFWNDDKCRILIGTRAIEQSLNLQVARHLINMDMILNPARMEQLAGRIRRDGSAHSHVFVHNLLTINTQEARYLPLLEREAALAAHIWDENSELFQALSATDLLRLISG
jgi:SNF2 family DNA or RNA helicase